MSYVYTDVPQIDELPECWTAEEIDLYLETEEQQLDDYYAQYEDDAALEYYSLCCAYGEEF